MGLAEIKHERRTADLEMAIRHMKDARKLLALAGEVGLAMQSERLINAARKTSNAG